MKGLQIIICIFIYSMSINLIPCERFYWSITIQGKSKLCKSHYPWEETCKMRRLTHDATIHYTVRIVVPRPVRCFLLYRNCQELRGNSFLLARDARLIKCLFETTSFRRWEFKILRVLGRPRRVKWRSVLIDQMCIFSPAGSSKVFDLKHFNTSITLAKKMNITDTLSYDGWEWEGGDGIPLMMLARVKTLI